MNPIEKSKYYFLWSRDPLIGGKIERYGDRTEIRVYLKDSVMKNYSQARMADPSRPLRVLVDGEVLAAIEGLGNVLERNHGRSGREDRSSLHDGAAR